MRLRAVELEDADLFYKWENDMELWGVSDTLRPFSRYALEQYVIGSQNESIYATRQMRLMIDLEDGQTVGCVDLYDFEPRNSKAAVGIMIDKAFRTKGLAVQALEQLWQYVRRIYGLNQLYAFVPCDNEPSRRLFLAAGYEHTARLRQWIMTDKQYKDVDLYQKTDMK